MRREHEIDRLAARRFEDRIRRRAGREHALERCREQRDRGAMRARTVTALCDVCEREEVGEGARQGMCPIGVELAQELAERRRRLCIARARSLREATDLL